MRAPLLAVAATALHLAACGGEGAPAPPVPPYAWQLPPGFVAPAVPASNPMTEAKVALGRRLFYDPALSVNGAESCGSCHAQALAFADGRERPLGTTGQPGRRNSPSLANAGYAARLTWASSALVDLEGQALVPMFGEDPVELGLSGREALLLSRLEADAGYRTAFAAAFPEEPAPFSVRSVVRALASFERTLVSGRSPFDRHLEGDAAALSPSAARGLALFRSDRLACGRCHAGRNLSDAAVVDGPPPAAAPFHNTGLYDEDGRGAYPAEDVGLMTLTGLPADMGRFRAPSLRNVAVTAPYMHDGSLGTLSDVLDHYAAGGRAARVNGSPSPLRSDLVRGFALTAEERADLLAFLESLTDAAFLADPRFGPP